MSFSQLLSFHRSRLNLTQAAAASFLQIPYRTYQDWESSRHAPNKMTQQLVVAILEGERTTDFIPTKAKQGRPSSHEVLQPA